MEEHKLMWPAGKNLNDFTGGSFMTIMRPGQGETSAVMENHNAEQILPWHRWTIQIYEDVLREECGFTGAHPCAFLASPPSSPTLFTFPSSSR